MYSLSLSLEPAATQVAWSCAAHGGRPQSQERPLRSAGRHMQVQHEGLQDRHRHMGGCRRRPCPLETEGEARDWARRQRERSQSGGQKGPQETQLCFSNKHTHKLHLLYLQQGLPITDWFLQPHETLQLNIIQGLEPFSGAPGIVFRETTPCQPTLYPGRRNFIVQMAPTCFFYDFSLLY